MMYWPGCTTDAKWMQQFRGATMLYVLNQEEMDDHQKRFRLLDRLPPADRLQEFCSFVADNLVMTEGWAKGRAWGCILTISKNNYCDNCPARHVCPHPNKKWSK